MGKTCLIQRYTAGQAIDGYVPTIGIDVARKMLTIHGNTVKLWLWVPPSSPKHLQSHSGRLTFVFPLLRRRKLEAGSVSGSSPIRTIERCRG